MKFCYPPCKANKEAENHPFEKETHLPNPSCWGFMFVFPGSTPKVGKNIPPLPELLRRLGSGDEGGPWTISSECFSWKLRGWILEPSGDLSMAIQFLLIFNATATVDGSEIRFDHLSHLRLVVHPIIYSGFIDPMWVFAGFQPSTVPFFIGVIFSTTPCYLAT